MIPDVSTTFIPIQDSARDVLAEQHHWSCSKVFCLQLVLHVHLACRCTQTRTSVDKLGLKTLAAKHQIQQGSLSVTALVSVHAVVGSTVLLGRS